MDVDVLSENCEQSPSRKRKETDVPSPSAHSDLDDKAQDGRKKQKKEEDDDDHEGETDKPITNLRTDDATADTTESGTKVGLSPSVIELEKKRTSLLQKLVAAPNIDATTSSVLQDVGNGLRYGRYASPHKPKPKSKSKGWQFHYNKETGGTDTVDGKKKKKEKKEKKKRKKSSSRSKGAATKSTTTTTTTTTSATLVSLPPANGVGLPPAAVAQSTPAAIPPSYHASYPYGAYPPAYVSAPPPPPTQVIIPYGQHTAAYPSHPSAYPHFAAYPSTYISMAPPPAASTPFAVSAYPAQGSVPFTNQPQPHQHQHQHQQQQQQALLNEAHLSFVATALAYIDNYKQYLWVFAPLPFCVLDEAIARSVLTTKAIEEQSVLALSFQVCLCRGAMLAGDVGVCSEYYNKADQLAQYLEGVSGMDTNYAFGAALLALSQHGQYYMLDTEKNDRYLKAAMRICVKMNALNSDVYLRCLYMVVCRPNAKISDVKNLNKELEKLKRMPYFALDLKVSLTAEGIVHTEEGGLGGSFVDTQQQYETSPAGGGDVNNNMGTNDAYGHQRIFPEGERLINGGGYQQQQHSVGNSSSSQSNCGGFISCHNLNAMNSVFVVIATVKRGLSLYRNEIAKAVGPEASEKLAQSLFQLLDLTHKLETEVKMIQLISLDPLPVPIVRFVKLFSLAIHAECKQLVRDYDDALDWAVKFLVKTKKPAYKFAFEGSPGFLSYILGIFMTTQQMELFWQQISAIESWIKIAPLVRSVVVSFTHKLNNSTPSSSSSTKQTSSSSPPKAKKPRRANTSKRGSSRTRAAESSPESTSIVAQPISLGAPEPLGWPTEGPPRGNFDPDSSASLSGLAGSGEDLLQQLDAQKEKRRLLKEKIEVMQSIMTQLKKKNNEPPPNQAYFL